ncbi:MAG: RnfABCDGE type electron transport complex subunit B [Clostridia bacterium]|nr:RnfABCDGE type electron transport complex subunit B [Clostridia bacterium]
MKEIIIPVLIVGGLGLLFGLLLAFASYIFAVKQDDRVEKISKVLPGANCGACGYAGCAAYAAAVVENGAPVNACSVGKAAVAEKVADIMGVKAEAAAERVAHVKCRGTCENTTAKYDYVGVQDCTALSKLAGGQKHCRNACLGFGTCTTVCAFDAISVHDGVASVNEELCTGCGACMGVCPHHVIELIPKSAKVRVNCSNIEKGQSANRHCKASCIGCRMCEKVCESDAIHVSDNVASIDYSKCTFCGKCSEKCPKKVISIKDNLSSDE